MMGGKIVTSGGPDLAQELEREGYEGLRKRLGIETPATAAPAKAPSDFFTDLPFEA